MNTAKPERSEVMKLSHELEQTGYNFAEAQRQAWKVAQAQAEMVKNLVEISFYRKNGTYTSRLATLNPAFLPGDKVEVTPRPTCPLQIIFWSVTDNAYRSFLAQNFITVKQVQSIQQLVAGQTTAA